MHVVTMLLNYMDSACVPAEFKHIIKRRRVYNI